MKCPDCGYNSFDYLEKCKKCGRQLSPVPIYKYLYEEGLGAEMPADSEANEKFDLATATEIIGEFRNIAEFEDEASAELEDSSEFQRQLEEAGDGGGEERKDFLPEGMVAAGLPARFLAFSIDFVFTLLTATVSLFIAANIMREPFLPGVDEIVSIWGLICIYAYVLATTYFIFLPSWCGTTFGNAVAGIKVVESDGSQVRFSKILLRWICWLFSLAIVFTGFAPALFDRYRRTLSDRVCGTFVIKA